MGAKRLEGNGNGGETTRVWGGETTRAENRGETTRGETTWGKRLGGDLLIPSA